MLPLIVFTAFALYLSIYDVQHHKLPNRIVFASVIAVFLAESVTSPTNLLSSLRIAFAYLLVFLFLSVISHDGLGMGDVKFSITCGLVVGYYSPNVWLEVLWLMFSLAALAGLGKLIVRLGAFKSAIAFAPFMSLSVITSSLNSLT